MSTALRTYYRGHTLSTLRDEAAGQSRVYHFDHQGTTQCLTDSTGAVTDRFASDAWGVEVKRTGASLNRQWYIGSRGYQRIWTNLLYVRQRYLDSRASLWLSVDPVSDRNTRYLYVTNGPTQHVDPTGTISVSLGPGCGIYKPPVRKCAPNYPHLCARRLERAGWFLLGLLQEDQKKGGACAKALAAAKVPSCVADVLSGKKKPRFILDCADKEVADGCGYTPGGFNPDGRIFLDIDLCRDTYGTPRDLPPFNRNSLDVDVGPVDMNPAVQRLLRCMAGTILHEIIHYCRAEHGGGLGHWKDGKIPQTVAKTCFPNAEDECSNCGGWKPECFNADGTWKGGTNCS